MNLLRDAAVNPTVAWYSAERTVAHDAEAACDRALGYPVPDEPVVAPAPVLTLQDADRMPMPDGVASLGAPGTGRGGAEGRA